MNKKVIFGLIAAAMFWFIMFSPWTKEVFNFWGAMIFSTAFLTFFSIVSSKADFREISVSKIKWVYIGIISAAVLYVIFLAGNFFSNMLFDFSKHQVTNIYSTKTQADKIFIGLALVLLIGPAEEIFWRGFIQHQFSKKIGGMGSLLLTTVIYALVHIWSFNFMLIMAALICGFFWGWMFYKYKNIYPVVISHAVWDLFIFIIIPIS